MHDQDAFPPTEESVDRLRRSGWSAGEAGFTGTSGKVVWQVDGSNGERCLVTPPFQVLPQLISRIMIQETPYLSASSRQRTPAARYARISRTWSQSSLARGASSDAGP